MSLHIILCEPYYDGSHKYWADTLKEYSTHHITIIDLPGRFWKWRLEGSAIHMIKSRERIHEIPDLFLCSSLMDVSLFKSLLPGKFKHIPIILYMHENQLSYPISKDDRLHSNPDYHYGFINYKSCLASDHILFNSQFHRKQFTDALKELLQRLPDYNYPENADEIYNRSKVLPIPLPFKELTELNSVPSKAPKSPTVLWNHRWSQDKRPDLFIQLCQELIDEGFNFKINFIGDHLKNASGQILEFFNSYNSYIEHKGYLKSRNEYLSVLQNSDILPVVSEHDFFGISVLEAVISGATPLLPENMVYSEHFAEASSFFYKNYSDLKSKLKIYLTAKEPLAQPSLERIRNYNTDSTIKSYDTYFEGIKKGSVA